VPILEVEEASVSIASNIMNAHLNFSSMDVSGVRIRTDVIRGGKPVVGFGFSSNGRYSAGGILGERAMSRLQSAPADSLLDEEQKNLA